MRQTIVFLILLGLLGVLGVSLVVGASNTRATVRALLNRAEKTTPASSASGAASASVSSVASVPAVALASAVPAPKPPVDRSLAVIGLGWDLLAPALLAADGVKATPTSAFGKADVQVTATVASSMTDIERALAAGGAAKGGADVAVLPLSELVAAYERVRALDLRVFYVSGWSQGRETLTGTALSKLPTVGNVTLDYAGSMDALSLALLTLDLTGMPLERLRIEERDGSALLHARSGNALDSPKQEDVVVSTREAVHLLPHVLVAPRPLLEEREAVLGDFVHGWLDGTDTLLKDRAKAARTLSALDGAPEAMTVLHALGDLEPIRLYENAALLGLSGRGAISIESLGDWLFRVRRAAHLGRASEPDTALVDGRVVTHLVRSEPKLVKAPEAVKRRPSPSGAVALLEHTFAKDDEQPIVDALGVLAAVFPRNDVRLTLSGRSAKLAGEWLDRAAARYDLDRARLLAGSAPAKPGRAALLEVLRAP